MIANLFGDFVKGSDLSGYSLIQQKGIRLHREIDNFMDQHPAVLSVMHELYEELPKVAGIAMDLYFDHLLSKLWSEFHSKPYNKFLQSLYRSISHLEEEYPKKFKTFLFHLSDKNWLHYYPLEMGLHKACNGVASRISFENALIHGLTVFKKHEKLITEAFYIYMKDAEKHFKDWNRESPSD